MSERGEWALLEWKDSWPQEGLRSIYHPYIVTNTYNKSSVTEYWKVTATGTLQEMKALEKLMLAAINRELINEGETDENK